jgi:hypothetical protein
MKGRVTKRVNGEESENVCMYAWRNVSQARVRAHVCVFHVYMCVCFRKEASELGSKDDGEQTSIEARNIQRVSERGSEGARERVSECVREE